MFTCKCGGLYSSVIMDVKVLKAKNKIYRHIYTKSRFSWYWIFSCFSLSSLWNYALRDETIIDSCGMIYISTLNGKKKPEEITLNPWISTAKMNSSPH